MEKLKRLPITRKMMMANISNAAETEKSRMRRSAYYNADGETPFFVLASIVSSPRLIDVFWQDVSPGTFIKAGDTFVEQHTMLTDYRQKRMPYPWLTGPD